MPAEPAPTHVALEVRLSPEDLDRLAAVVTARVTAELATELAARAKPPEDDSNVGVAEFARAIGYSVRSVRHLIGAGRVRIVQLGGRGSKVLIPRSEIARIRAGGLAPTRKGKGGR